MLSKTFLKQASFLCIFISLSSFIYAEESQSYIIQKGDTLYSIAKKYAIPVDTILKVNGIKDAKTLIPGKKIIIPAEYVVQKGDTLYGIAKDHNITLSELLKANGFTEKTALKVGMKINVPMQVSKIDAGKLAAAPVKTDAVKPNPVPDNTELRAVKTGVIKEQVNWPCPGEAHYMDGKLQGVIVLGKRGDTVRSLVAGTVVSADPYRGFGRVVFVQSKDGYIYMYGGHETLLVRSGDTVQPGQALGTLGLDSRDEKPVLYFLVYKNGKPIDPVKAPRG